jgi:hypothetical protein
VQKWTQNEPRQFLVGKQILVLEYVSYSPELAPRDFLLFPELKSSLKEIRFQSTENIHKKTANLLKTTFTD